MRSGEEIQAALRGFVSRWESYAGSEKAEAQTFLNELFECFGSDRREAGAVFEDAHTSAGIMDLHWPGVAIVEMKAPSQADKLDEHRRQALDYWRNSASVQHERPAPPYVVLCAFQRFEVWEPGKYPNAPRAAFTLAQLPEYYETLLFLTGSEEPLFAVHHRDQGIDIEPIVAQIARVTLWMGHRQMMDRFGAAEPALPLTDLSTVRDGDALALTWPETDCVIGNPRSSAHNTCARRAGMPTSNGSSGRSRSASRTTACTGSARPTTT